MYELRGISKANGKSMERFIVIKTKHWPSALSINKNTGLDVKMEPNKEKQRRIVGIILLVTRKSDCLQQKGKLVFMHDF